jgi:histidine triad (HIT) family protein
MTPGSTCPFCDYLLDRKPCAFVTRGEEVASFVNPRQYERGALLVIPNTHVPSILDIETEELEAVYREVQRLSRALMSALGAEGLNVFQNNGARAGQTVAHFHVHVVPRYRSSDPARLFREADYPISPLQEQEILAQELRDALSGGAT